MSKKPGTIQTPNEPGLAGAVSGSNLDRRAHGRAWLLPAISDWVFCSILLWMFFGAAGAVALLADGDTGWHIRAGEYVLENRTFPRQDLFSYSMEGEPWFAWEWLSDVVFALAHSKAGLAGVVFLAGILIATSAALLLRYTIWYGANMLPAIFAALLFCSVSTIHWLARPHLFTWIFFVAAVWLLESDRRRPGARIYLLVPLAALWTNLHGGFAALLVTVGIFAVGGSLEEWWERFSSRPGRRHYEGETAWRRIPPAGVRYGGVFLLCLAVTLLNPYGWELHRHIAGYLKSDFILKNVQEFQAPDFRSESELIFEVTLLGCLLVAGRLLTRREVTPALLILAWGHASLLSVRHLPLFMLVAAPIAARELTRIVDAGASRGNVWLRALRGTAGTTGGRVSNDAPAFGWLSGVAAAVVALMLITQRAQPRWRAEFSEIRFPVSACDALGEQLGRKRLLSTDQWGDYLIYRFYPNAKVFIDGRSDFYGGRLGEDYLAMMNGQWTWQQAFEKHRFEAALLPAAWPLVSALKQHPDWELTYDDGFAVYFERRLMEGDGAVLADSDGMEQGEGVVAGAGRTRPLTFAAPFRFADPYRVGELRR